MRYEEELSHASKRWSLHSECVVRKKKTSSIAACSIRNSRWQSDMVHQQANNYLKPLELCLNSKWRRFPHIKFLNIFKCKFLCKPRCPKVDITAQYIYSSENKMCVRIYILSDRTHRIACTFTYLEQWPYHFFKLNIKIVE